MKNKLFLLLILLSLTFEVPFANTLKTARELYLDGKYVEALPIFEKEYKKKKRDGSINHWLGVCLYETGDLKAAEKYLTYADTRKVIESSHYLARIYFNNYDFENSLAMFERYQELLDNSKKELSPEAEEELSRIKLAKSMIDHVEKISIIDSITVDKELFFNYYRISPESGTLVSSAKLPVTVERNTVGFMTQSEDKIMWAMPDENGVSRIVESLKLIDGSWDEPQFLNEELNNGGDANYPYMMQDGATLYYASTGEGSIGGYDIFMTRLDAETGEYFKPQNVGMPYNSVADDYLLVLDDVSGLGWWATDRNNIPGKVTIYVFVRNDIRENYGASEPELVSYALISNYRKTWGENDYSSLRSKLYNLDTNASSDSNEFMFYIKKGVVYTSFTDFKSLEASERMKQLLEMYDKLLGNKTLLAKKRRHYNLVNEDLKATLQDDILNLEKEIRKAKVDIFNTENAIRTLELNN